MDYKYAPPATPELASVDRSLRSRLELQMESVDWDHGTKLSLLCRDYFGVINLARQFVLSVSGPEAEYVNVLKSWIH